MWQFATRIGPPQTFPTPYKWERLKNLWSYTSWVGRSSVHMAAVMNIPRWRKLRGEINPLTIHPTDHLSTWWFFENSYCKNSGHLDAPVWCKKNLLPACVVALVVTIELSLLRQSWEKHQPSRSQKHNLWSQLVRHAPIRQSDLMSLQTKCQFGFL